MFSGKKFPQKYSTVDGAVNPDSAAILVIKDLSIMAVNAPCFPALGNMNFSDNAL